MSSYLVVNIFIFFNTRLLDSEKLITDKNMNKQGVGDDLRVCVLNLLP